MISKLPWKLNGDGDKIYNADGELVAQDYKFEHVDDFEAICDLVNGNLPAKKILCNCPDCGVKPGEIHKNGCRIEICSVCGLQRISNDCDGHDKAFSRWTGFLPNELEMEALVINDEEYDLLRFPDGLIIIKGII